MFFIGVPCQIGENKFIPLTSGVLYTAANWGVDENGVTLAPPVNAVNRYTFKYFMFILLNILCYF